MAVSVSNTAYGIIADAMVDAGLLQEGDDPNSDQLASNLRRLCDIINLWQTQGLKLFLLQEITVPLVLNQVNYTLNPASGMFPAKHMRIVDARVDTAGNRRPILAISWNEWNSLTPSAGAVTGYLVDKQATSLVVKVWNTPDVTEAANSLILLVQTQAPNPFNLESDVSFPQEWRIALRWGLADDIATGQPQAIMDRAETRARVYREMLENWDVEDASTSFAPASNYTEGGRFR